MKNFKGTLIVIIIIIAGLIVSLLLAILALGVFSADTSLHYNAKLSELKLNKKFDLQYLGNEPAMYEDYEIYQISTGKLDPKFVKKVKPNDWHFGASEISYGMFYDGKAKFGNKEVVVNDGRGYDDLILVQGGKRRTLETAKGLLANLGFDRLYWLSDGRHLVIEQDGQIGLYDVNTSKYALLVKGRLSREIK